MAEPTEFSSDEECLQEIMYPVGRTYPLNSKRIVTSQLQTLAGSPEKRQWRRARVL